MLVVLVTGSSKLTAVEREWAENAVSRELKGVIDQEGGAHKVHVVHGNAWGVDKAAHKAAEAMNTAQISVFQAQWSTHGKSAGMIRNRVMMDFVAYQPHEAVVLAFLPKGTMTPGTANTIELAIKYNIPVRVVERKLASRAN